jgi:hypothetical protein
MCATTSNSWATWFGISETLWALTDVQDNDFSSTGGLLGKSMKKVSDLVNSSNGLSICYIVGFAVFVFIVIYFLSSR